MKKSMSPARNAFSKADAGGNAKKEGVKLPTLSFKGRPSMFSGGRGLNNKSFNKPSFVPPVVRTTQNKGGGGK